MTNIISAVKLVNINTESAALIAIRFVHQFQLNWSSRII